MKGMLITMKKESKKIEKLCSFYVSDWHLVTMILPYISCRADENVKIITILENDIEKNIQTLVEKLNIKNKEKILNINWKNVKSEKYSDIEKRFEEEVNESKENSCIILVNGNRTYIEKNNENIEKLLQKSKMNNVKIINFFEVTEFNKDITQILDTHDKVFNTSGEKEINEVFEGYKKENKQEQRCEQIEIKKVVGGNLEN